MKSYLWPILLCALFFGGITPAAALDHATREAINTLLRQGHQAFGDKRYDDALKFYEEARGLGSDSFMLPGLIETVKLRKALGALKDPVVQHVAVMFVVRRDVRAADGSVTRYRDVTPAQKERVYWITRWLTQVIEGLSHGNLTLKFGFVDAVSTYDYDARFKPDNPDYLNLERFFLDNMNVYDNFVSVSNKRSPAMGLARRYPIVHGAIYGPHRGMFQVNATYHGPEVWLHEFYHTVEWSAAYGGTPHGWRLDHSNEYDFYRRHFENEVPRRGWWRLVLTQRYRARAVDEKGLNAWREVLDAYKNIPIKVRLQARDFFKQGRHEEDPERKHALLKKALDLSPYNMDALKYMVALEEGRRRARSTGYTRRLKKVLSFAEWYARPDSLWDQGDFLGGWNWSQMSRAGRVLSWDAAAYIRGRPEDRATYQITFLYQRSYGGKAVSIDWTALQENGTEIARDGHPGWSGSQRRNNVYRLTLTRPQQGARYEIKARLTSQGGLNSNGIVLLKKVAN